MKVVHLMILCAIIILSLKVKPARGKWCNETEIEHKVIMEKYQEEQVIRKQSLACRVKLKSSSSCTKTIYHQKERPVNATITTITAKCCPGYFEHDLEGCKFLYNATPSTIFDGVQHRVTPAAAIPIILITEGIEMDSTVTEIIVETTTEMIPTSSPISSEVEDTTTSTTMIAATTDCVTEEVPENHQGGQIDQQINWILWCSVTAVIIAALLLAMKAYKVWIMTQRLHKCNNQVVFSKIRDL